MRMGKRTKTMWNFCGCGTHILSPGDVSEWLKNLARIEYAAGARCNSCKEESQQEEDTQGMNTVSMVVNSSEVALRSTVSRCAMQRDLTAIESASTEAKAVTGKRSVTRALLVWKRTTPRESGCDIIAKRW